MRIASRHMPKYRAKPIGAAAWVFLVALVAAIGYLAVTRPKAVGVLIGVFIVGSLFARFSAKREEAQLRKLAEARNGESICEFAREFDLRAVDTWIVRAVYEQLQRQLEHIHPAFPLRADDRLKEDLRLDDDTLDLDLAVEVEERTGRSLDNTRANPYLGKVRTVRDLVLFFQAQAPRGAA